MEINALPFYDQSDNPTNCCPRFKPEGWDNQDLHFRNKRFVKATTKSVMHLPIDMGKVFARTMQAIEDADALAPDDVIVLSRDVSPWKAEHFFAVSKDVPGQEMAQLSGDFRTKVFEGPYSDARKWYGELVESVGGDKKKPPDTYFFYTTCPKCAKHYGKNYVVGIVEDKRA